MPYNYSIYTLNYDGTAAWMLCNVRADSARDALEASQGKLRSLSHSGRIEDRTYFVVDPTANPDAGPDGGHVLFKFEPVPQPSLLAVSVPLEDVPF